MSTGILRNFIVVACGNELSEVQGSVITEPGQETLIAMEIYSLVNSRSSVSLLDCPLAVRSTSGDETPRIIHYPSVLVSAPRGFVSLHLIISCPAELDLTEEQSAGGLELLLWHASPATIRGVLAGVCTGAAIVSLLDHGSGKGKTESSSMFCAPSTWCPDCVS